MQTNIVQSFLIALGAGFLPAIIWLWFLLHEDSKSPEPKSIIGLCFLAGMASVVLAIFLEDSAQIFFSGTLLVIVWALIEEVLKFGLAFFIAISRAVTNEPIDAVVYMITVALGFAALENSLYLLGPIFDNTYLVTAALGGLRFLGANLLHVISSASIGVFIALSFYKSRTTKIIHAIMGILTATFLHSLFNLLIMGMGGKGSLISMILVWVSVVILFLLFEIIKKITPTIYAKR